MTHTRWWYNDQRRRCHRSLLSSFFSQCCVKGNNGVGRRGTSSIVVSSRSPRRVVVHGQQVCNGCDNVVKKWSTTLLSSVLFARRCTTHQHHRPWPCHVPADAVAHSTLTLPHQMHWRRQGGRQRRQRRRIFFLLFLRILKLARSRGQDGHGGKPFHPPQKVYIQRNEYLRI